MVGYLPLKFSDLVFPSSGYPASPVRASHVALKAAWLQVCRFEVGASAHARQLFMPRRC